MFRPKFNDAVADNIVELVSLTVCTERKIEAK